jgi:hypothetical protein
MCCRSSTTFCFVNEWNGLWKSGETGSATPSQGDWRWLSIRPAALGVRDRPTAARSPWQNGYAERLIGSIRRDCLDHFVVFGERHLRHLLESYQRYYNEARTHLSLSKDAPVSRAVQTVGSIIAKPLLGGLHHQYVRI